MQTRLATTFATMLLVLSSAVASAPASKKTTTTPTVIVIPPDAHYLALATALTRLRTVSICTYVFEDGAESPTMRYWEKRTNSWKPTDLEDYEAMSVFQDFPERMLLVLANKQAGTVMIPASEWCFDVKIISKPTEASIKDSIKTMFSLSESELNTIPFRETMRKNQ